MDCEQISEHLGKGFTVVLCCHRRPGRKRKGRYNHGTRAQMATVIQVNKRRRYRNQASRMVEAFVRELESGRTKIFGASYVVNLPVESKSSCPWFLPICVCRARMIFQARAKINLH